MLLGSLSDCARVQEERLPCKVCMALTFLTRSPNDGCLSACYHRLHIFSAAASEAVTRGHPASLATHAGLIENRHHNNGRTYILVPRTQQACVISDLALARDYID